MERRHGGLVTLHGCLTALIVLLGVLLIATLAEQRQQRIRRTRCATELREIASAFLDYRRQNGAWPPASNGVSGHPRGMEPYLRDTNWLAGTPVGGGYSWMVLTTGAPGGAEAAGAIAITAFSPALPLSLSPDDLLRLDAMLDDGDPATGRFRRGFNGWPVYYVRN